MLQTFTLLPQINVFYKHGYLVQPTTYSCGTLIKELYGMHYPPKFMAY